jgi:hypothetical protein
MTSEATYAARGTRALIGRDALIGEVERLVARGQSVLLCGQEGVGKSAVIQAVTATVPAGAVAVVDPMQRIASRTAADIRRGLERDRVYLAATRSLERSRMGAVRRIAFWFTTVPVSPLTDVPMRRLVAELCADLKIGPRLATEMWCHGVVRIARGRPGTAIAIMRSAAYRLGRGGSLPSPELAHVDACMREARRHLAPRSWPGP